MPWIAPGVSGPGNRTLDDFFAQVRDRYPEQLFMADCSDYEEGMHAAEIGLDLIGTTMHGYTDYTRGRGPAGPGPDEKAGAGVRASGHC